jgi:transketolase
MIRQDIAVPCLNVKMVGSHTGLSASEYGVTHQSTEDVGAMRILSNVMIVEPSDGIQADHLFEKTLAYEGPVYFRLARNRTPLIYSDANPFDIIPTDDFQLGKGYKLHEGSDITLIGSGPILCEALDVARRVSESVRVVDMPTVKPVDRDIIEQAAMETGFICVVQDHFKIGGLADEVERVLVEGAFGVKYVRVMLDDFCEAGKSSELYKRYGLNADAIIHRLGLTTLVPGSVDRVEHTA